MPFVPEAHDAYNSLCQKKKTPLTILDLLFYWMDGSRTSRDFSLVNAKKKKKNCWDNYYFDHAMTT
jgi:hypothetical protein